VPLAAALAALATISPCQDPALAPGCPDLVVAAPSRLSAQRLRDGRVRLRMRNRIINAGTAPAELVGRRTGPRTMTAEQVIVDAFGVRRRYATGARLHYTSVPTRGGDYWKFDNALRMELWTEAPDGTPAALVRTSPKLRYCLRDLDRVLPTLPGSPRRAVYPACDQSARRRRVTLGTSIGWQDAYPATYPKNYIDVTGLRGCFVVLHRVDPLDHIRELDETDNVSGVAVRLPFRRGRGPQPCPPYVPAA
jgi:hypothetical protein